MEKTLHFLATYNTQIIQAGFAIVFLLIIIYVYRQFFMANMSETTSGQDGGVSAALEQKLNILIEQQQKSRSQGAATGNPAGGGDDNMAELDKLKTEIYNLRQQAAESEKLMEELRHKDTSPVDETALNDATQAQKVAEAKAEEMRATIQNLESRLAEYEIIADDIAELSQLRSDNAKLTQQLADIKANGLSAAPAEPVVEAVQPKVTEESAQVEETPKASISGLTEDDAQSLVDAALAEAANSSAAPAKTEAVAEESPSAATDDISDVDRNLINDFEKTVLKKENE